MQDGSIDINRFEQLLQTIAPGSALLGAWPLQGGISAEMIAFEIKSAEGQISGMIFRQPSEQTLQRDPQTAENEFRTLQLTKSLGLIRLAGTILQSRPSESVFNFL